MDFETIKRNVLMDASFGREPSPAELAARSACLDLLYSSFALIDFGQATRSIPLYAEGAQLLVEGRLASYAEIRERFASREADKARRTRHLVTNFDFRMSDENTGWSLALVTIVLEDDARNPGVVPLTVADCGDQYTRTRDGWRIAFRYLQPIAGAPR